MSRATSSLYEFFIAPRARDEDGRRREYILNVILAATLVMFVVMDAFVGYYSFRDGAQYREVSFAAFSALAVFFVVLLALSRKGSFLLASYLLIAAYMLSISYAAFRWGANLPAALLGYALIVVLASILIGTRFGLLTFSAIAIFLIPLWYADRHGLIIPQVQQVRDADGIVFVVLLLFIALVSWLSNREIERSLARARNSERELKEERDSLEVKVEERTRELHAAELEKIDHLYRFAEFGQLASGLFHDLLNALNVVSLRIERGEGDENVHTVLENAMSIQGEIDRFRDAFRKQLGRDDAPEIFSITRSIEDVIQFLSYQAKHDGIRLEFIHGSAAAEGDDPFEYFGSPLKFHQVAMNLISNAIESYENVLRGSGGARLITVKLHRENEAMVLRVEDSGCGVPEALQAKIFDPFFTTKHSEKKGTGIGLAITRRIIENDLAGTISLQSVEGNGSIFTVHFPRRAKTKISTSYG